jgi:hypothetical protein
LLFQDIPNFAPVAALALFAGYCMRSGLGAAAVPLVIMTLTDFVIGGYDWRLMIVVYSMLALPVCCRGFLRRHFGLRRGALATTLAGLLGCSLLASVSFFLVTNFACWILFDHYERSLSGLVHCYTMALPFFRHTLLGDAFFAICALGGYSLFWSVATSKRFQGITPRPDSD